MSNSHRSLLTSKRKMKSAKASTDQVREQDQFMPIANVIRIMRKILPPHAKISDEAKETIQECVSEFISFITEEANDRCQGEERKTVTAEDVLWSMRKLGFDDYVEPLARYLERYRMSEGQPSLRRSSGSSSGSALGFLPPNILPRPSPLPQHPSLLPQHPPTLHQHPPPLLQHPPSLFPHPDPHPSPPPLFTHQGFGMFDPFDPSQGFFRADDSASTSGSAGPSNFIANFESGSGSGNFIANFDPFVNNK